ncbi:carbohydrate porin [Leptolyngbya sp. FACHB-261]|nr:carbohydrate porin [Leptolyngbya sp. FACHB-261]
MAAEVAQSTSPEPVVAVEALPAASVDQTSAIAAPEMTPVAPIVVAQAAPEAAPAPAATREQINSVSQLAGTTNSMSQVTSVSQLSDVRPTDWAFQALQSLVERYGVIAGYPDGTYRGNRAMTRYEFAAGLNAALDRVNELIAAGLADKVSREDLATLQRLQEEFAAELATLRGRVDSLEARTAELEANQFSTTTKLSGQVILSFNGGSIDNSPDPNTTFISRARLNLNTSFTGDDLLLTQLQAGTGSDVDNAGQFSGGIFSGLDYANQSSEFRLNRLNYTFPLFTPDLTASIYATGFISDYVDFGSYNNNSATDFTSSWAVNNYLVLAGDRRGAGAALTFNPGKGPLTVTAAYRASGATIADPDDDITGDNRNGLFGDPNLGAVEVTFAPFQALTLRALYTGGADGGDKWSALGGSFELNLGRSIALFGRYGYVFDYANSAIANGFADPGATAGDIVGAGANPQYWSAGIAFPDLFVPGGLAGIAVGQPFIEESVGDVTQSNLEAFYRFPLSSNITVTPSVQVINNAGNDSSNGTSYVGTLRTVFSF